MRCKVGVWTMIPPQYSWYLYTPHFYSSSAARPSFTHQGCVLHGPAPPLCGGHRSPRRLIESRSVANHVTLRPSSVCLAPPEGGTRCKTKLLLPYSYVQLLVQALTSRGVWPGRPLAPGLPRPCCRRLAAGGARGWGAAASSAGTHAAS